MNRRPLAAAKRMLPIWREYAEPFAKAAAPLASCTKGCDACCYQYVGTSLAEGTLIAAHLLEKGTSPRELAQLKARLHEDMTVLVNITGDIERRWMDIFRACPFLDKAAHTCTIYAVRPSACRMQFVNTPPKFCSADMPGGRVGIIDASGPNRSIILAMLQATRGSIPLVSTMLQMAVLAGFEVLTRTPREFARWWEDNGVDDGIRRNARELIENPDAPEPEPEESHLFIRRDGVAVTRGS